MKILLVSGSLRKHANSKKVIDYASTYFTNQGFEVDLFDMHVDRLPLFDNELETFEHSQVVRLQTLAKEANGFFICTPEYHNGMAGVLKNALDFLSGDHFRFKPVGIAATAGGGKGGINALNNLRTVLRGVRALVTVNQAAMDPQDLLETGIRPAAQERIDLVLDELVQLVNQLSKK